MPSPELEELATDEEFRRRLSDAYYDGRIGYDTVEAVLGREEALRMKKLLDVDRPNASWSPNSLRMVSRVTMPSTMANIPEWTDAPPSESSGRRVARPGMSENPSPSLIQTYC